MALKIIQHTPSLAELRTGKQDKLKPASNAGFLFTFSQELSIKKLGSGTF